MAAPSPSRRRRGRWLARHRRAETEGAQRRANPNSSQAPRSLQSRALSSPAGEATRARPRARAEGSLRAPTRSQPHRSTANTPLTTAPDLCPPPRICPPRTHAGAPRRSHRPPAAPENARRKSHRKVTANNGLPALRRRGSPLTRSTMSKTPPALERHRNEQRTTRVNRGQERRLLLVALSGRPDGRLFGIGRMTRSGG